MFNLTHAPILLIIFALNTSLCPFDLLYQLYIKYITEIYILSIMDLKTIYH